jgi:oxygen-independent coproporphyrinogen-3 oxidase
MVLKCAAELHNELSELIRAFENGNIQNGIPVDCIVEIGYSYAENGEKGTITATAKRFCGNGIENKENNFNANDTENNENSPPWEGIKGWGDRSDSNYNDVENEKNDIPYQYIERTEHINNGGALIKKRRIKRMLKRLLYDVLSEITGRTLPYGSLTGVRPTKLAYELTENELNETEISENVNQKNGFTECQNTLSETTISENGINKNQIINETNGINKNTITNVTAISENTITNGISGKASSPSPINYASVQKTLVGYFRVSPQKAALITEVLKNQEGIYQKTPALSDVYINIPFCLSRCSYCTFVTAATSQTKKFIEPYVSRLLDEIALIGELSGGKCNALYVGGGTPTALGNADLEKILRALSRFSYREFTVEAGRPDTITEDNLALIKDFGANRISVNPQSFNEKTLLSIGRNHGVKEIYTAFDAARRRGFAINTDLIAALPGETPADFLKSVRAALSLEPENITIHNLALKRGSSLTLGNFTHDGNDQSSKMTDGAYGLLTENGYSPYYMYRQKYMSGNLENCGYTKPGFACVYNVDIMEETHGILAAGSGAISKRIENGKIDRQANVKDIKGYIERFNELADKKREFFKRVEF